MNDKGWHFVGKTLRFGQPIPEKGVWLEHRGKIVMCESGLHYSRTPFEALQYAPGEVLCKVSVEDAVYETDKGVARRRRIDNIINVRELLYDFACKEALAVLPENAPQAVKDYLTATESWKRDELRSAARSTARSAAWSAAWSAARSAAWDAARDAAWDAAWDAVLDAARLRQAKEFNERVYALMGE